MQQCRKQTILDDAFIGYIELTFARTSGLSVASIQNKAGEWVAPSPASAYAAIVAADEILSKDLRAPIVDPPAAAKGAYPITGITFILIPKDNPSTDGEQEALKDYINFTLYHWPGRSRRALLRQASRSGAEGSRRAPLAAHRQRQADAIAS